MNGHQYKVKWKKFTLISKKVNESEDASRHQTQLNNFRAQIDKIIGEKMLNLQKILSCR